MQNLGTYLNVLTPHCLFTMTHLLSSAEDYGVFTPETPNVKREIKRKFSAPTKIGQILAVLGFGGQGFQKVVIFTPKGTSLRETTSFEPFCVKIDRGV